MKRKLIPSVPVLTAGILALALGQAVAQTNEEALAAARSVLKADRQAAVKQTLQLTDKESQAFWPLYQQYRADMDKVGDGLVKLMREYAKYYPNVPEERAKQMLKDYLELQTKQVATRHKHLKEFGKVLPADKNLRFAQVENRLDLALQLRLATMLPLVPIEGQMGAESGGTVAYEAGVPGGVVVQTIEMKATVAAIDKENRKITLVNPEGIKKTLKAGPEVINFDQIQVDDQVKVKAAEELVVEMKRPGEPEDAGSASLVALAPKGAQPGGVMAETRRITATVKELDPEKHTATLQFEDGSTQTFPVRSDVDLKQRKAGEQVVFRVTQMVAISVDKP